MRRTASDADVLVLGAGLAGLSAGHALARAGRKVTIVERRSAVGGLARTIAHGPFRFDLGGHRFVTQDRSVAALVQDLVGEESLTVRRTSQILLRDRYIDYPLRPLNAVSGLGALTASRIVLDWAAERLKGRLAPRELVSLEDWVVHRFGRTLFDLYFREYSEKVWGIGCERISMDWVAQRIQGLSLGVAVRNAFLRRRGPEPRTLTDEFLYPSRGIGRIARRLEEEIGAENEILCNVQVTRLLCDGFRVRAAVVRDGPDTRVVEGSAFVSTVPITELVRMLEPRPPADVLRAAAGLKFRALVAVAVMLDRDRATDQTWLYFPERTVPFGRIHEPTNWSAGMAPEGKTLLVAEQFCSRGDDTWSAGDDELAARTIEGLHALRIISPKEVLGTVVLRVPNAYPLFEVGYQDHRSTIRAHLAKFRNLFLAGRGGTFSYHNMDHAMASGIDAARRILAGDGERRGARQDELESALRGRQSA